MEFNPIDLLYFAIVFPVVIIVSIFIKRTIRHKKYLVVVLILSVLLFYVRIILVLFQEWIGIMPYINDDILFYVLLTVFGAGFSVYYVFKIEGKTFKEIGFEITDLKKTLIYTALSFLPLIALFPLIIILAEIQLATAIAWEKIVLGATFGLILGGFYEEVMFRGVIQNYLMDMTDHKKAILFTALIFTATHVGYLPFIGFGIFYIFLFVMALLLSVLRYKFNQLACFILHGGIVFILVIAV